MNNQVNEIKEVDKDQTWWEAFKEEIADEPQVLKLVELVDKADKAETQKSIDKALSEIQKSKYLKKRGKERVRGNLEKRCRTLQKRLERAMSDNFGLLVKYLRDKNDLTLQTLSDMTGISPSYINRIEKGQRKAPGYKIIESLAEAFNVNIQELLEVANLEVEPETQDAQEIGRLLLANDIVFTDTDKVISKEEKEILIELIDKIVKSPWGAKTKHIDSIEIVNLIDEFKSISNG